MPVHLDPRDTTDRKILRLQRSAARDAGRDGRDRAAVTKGRPDLEKAYDEGAAEAAAPPAAPAAGGGGTKKGPGRASKAFGKSSAYLSRGRWRPTLRPPTRARDAGGLLTGIALYTAVAVYLRYGPEGWTGWLKAKFLNQPMSGTPATGLDTMGTGGSKPSGGNGAT